MSPAFAVIASKSGGKALSDRRFFGAPALHVSQHADRPASLDAGRFSYQTVGAAFLLVPISSPAGYFRHGQFLSFHELVPFTPPPINRFVACSGEHDFSLNHPDRPGNRAGSSRFRPGLFSPRKHKNAARLLQNQGRMVTLGAGSVLSEAHVKAEGCPVNRGGLRGSSFRPVLTVL